jgi:hypothetical protein
MGNKKEKTEGGKRDKGGDDSYIKGKTGEGRNRGDGGKGGQMRGTRIGGCERGKSETKQ